MLAGVRDSPMFAVLAVVAPTLVYDCTIGDETGLDVIARVPVPTSWSTARAARAT